MSDYWDAVARAALDLPAAAKPRPHSRFEPDASEPGAEPLGLREEEGDAAGPTPVRRAESSPGSRAETPLEPSNLAAERSVEVVRLEAAPARTRQDESTASDREAGTAPATRFAAEAPAPAAPPVLWEVDHLERVEVHRVERTQTVVETAARPVIDVPEPVASRSDQPVAASPWEAPRPLEVPVAEGEAPIVAIAEPVPPPALLDRALTPEPVALVIEIDRIDIRIEPETIGTRVVAAVPRRTEAAVPSLSDYLARRSEGRA